MSLQNNCTILQLFADHAGNFWLMLLPLTPPPAPPIAAPTEDVSKPATIPKASGTQTKEQQLTRRLNENSIPKRASGKCEQRSRELPYWY